MNVLSKLNTPEALEVFRQNHVTSTGINALREGHAKHGDKFMFDLMKAVSTKSSVLNANWGLDDYLTVTDVDTSNLDAKIDYDLGLSKPKRTLEQWIEIFGKAGSTVADIKKNIFSSGVDPYVVGEPGKSGKSSMIIYIVAAVVVLAIGYLIFKK